MNDSDKQLAKELGFDSLTPEFQAQEVAKYRETLRLRVYLKLDEQMTDEQLEEFGKISDQKVQDEWFAKNFPDYDKLVADEEAQLREDIKKGAEDFRHRVDASDTEA
jgi:hypothetical protein